MQKLVEGYECRDIRVLTQRQLNQHIQKNFNIVVNGNNSTINSIIHRDQVVDPNEVYNQYKRIQERFYKKHIDQQESIISWLNELSVVKGYDVYLSPDFNNKYTFTFMSAW
jgi:hypothetical protein